jgi:DNA invertase Pin-like site-specific DNA recombinase
MTGGVLRASETKTKADTNNEWGTWLNASHEHEPLDMVSTNHEGMPFKAKQEIEAVYLRVSTDDQDTDLQRQYIMGQLSANNVNMDNVVWFEEEDGVSASKNPTLQTRPQGSKLHDEVSRGNVKRIWCYKLDRLFRSQWAAHHFIGICQEKQTDVFSSDSPQGVLSEVGFMMYSVNFMMAELEVKRLAKRTSDGMKAKRAKGGATTHSVWGWDVAEYLDENGNKYTEVTPNWQEQAVIVHIRKALSDGKSMSSIAKKFNNLGLKGKRGGKWTASSIKRCLSAKQHEEITRFEAPKRMMKWPFSALRTKQEKEGF